MTYFQEMVGANALRACRMRGCRHPRAGLSAWCKEHGNRARLYGHPDAGPLRPSNWATERKEVSALLADNSAHPGLVEVLNYLRTWASKASESERAFKGAREVARLKQAGVSELTMLVEACAFWLWSRSHRFPSDAALDFALSRALFALAPRPRRALRGVHGTWGQSLKSRRSYAPKPLPSALAYVGSHLRQSLAAFMVNVAETITNRRARQKDPDVLQRLPFEL